MSASADQPVSTDIACGACGYNLRGLLGDPVRCPECGEQATRAELRASLERGPTTDSLHRELHSAATLAAFPPGLVMLMAALSLSFGGIAYAEFLLMRYMPIYWLVLVPPVAVIYRRLPGSWGVLAQHHAYVTLCNAIDIGIWLGITVGTAVLLDSGVAGVVAALIAGVGLAVLDPMRWLRRTARSLLRPLAAEWYRNVHESRRGR